MNGPLDRVIVVHGERGQVVDGIRDHGERLVAELARLPVEAQLRPQSPTSVRASVREWRDLGSADGNSLIILQYSPFCFARWGFAPWLPACFLAAGARRKGPALALIIHEPYVPMETLRSAAMGMWQRLQLALLRIGADVVFASIEPWAEQFRRQIPGGEVHHLPVGSNFPDRRSLRSRERLRMGLGDDDLLIAAMGRRHPSWLGGHVVAAVSAIAGTGRSTVLLNLGADAPSLPGLDPAIRQETPGYLGPEELAARLAAADLFLAPLIDGVSTRRGTLMAALQHGLPVLGTDGPLTDRVLRESTAAIRLVPVGEVEAFAAAAVAAVGDPGGLAATGVAGRELYETKFDWPVAVRTLTAALRDR